MYYLPQCVKTTLQQLENKGHEAYVVGGACRDLIIGRITKDFDIATSATPKQVQNIFSNTQMVGEKFGVVIVKTFEMNIEVATFRKEGVYTDHRHPDSVTFGSMKEDMERRDFTMNAIYMSADGKVIGYDGAMEHIAEKRISCVGDPAKRFEEDALRILRACRFAAQLDFNINHNTVAEMQRSSNNLKKVSKERITEEILKMLESKNVSKGLFYLSIMFPELDHSYLISGELNLLNNTTPKALIRLARIISIEPNCIEKFFHFLRLPLRDEKIVRGLVNLSQKYEKSLLADSCKRELLNEAENISPGEGIGLALATTRLIKTRNPEAALAFDCWLNSLKVNPSRYTRPSLPIDGNVLIAHGFVGKQIGKALETVKKKFWENPEMTYIEAIKISEDTRKED